MKFHRACLLLAVVFAFLPSTPVAARSWFGGNEPAQPTAVRQRQVEFLQRIRQSDPNSRTIEKAIFNERNELGLILNRSVPMASIPALMKSILAQMARQFPQQDLTAIAYAASNPPLKIGTARLNARTREMTFEHARR